MKKYDNFVMDTLLYVQLIMFLFDIHVYDFSKASSRNTSRPGSAHSMSLDGGDTRERPRTGSIQSKRTESKPGVYKETMMFGYVYTTSLIF